MDNTKSARNAFLYFMALVYMFAFASWFLQVPGLYGNDGLLPIKNVLSIDKTRPVETLFSEKPTILWLFLFYGFSHQLALEIVCLLGVGLAFLCLIFRTFRSSPIFAALWFLYFSIFQVGQTFSWFQWDTLLLESGFLAILVAPLTPKHRNDAQHRLPFFLVRWLLFRLMFASGIVKLTSGCPTWWGLTALDYHFETQCIPTPFSWWSHQFPKWILKLGVVGTYVIEIALPFLFFAPIRKLRLIGAYGQVLLMAAIILTGNYNFFNLLTVALCFSVIDDNHVRYITMAEKRHPTKERTLHRVVSQGGTVAVCLAYAYFTAKLFGLRLYEKRQPIYSDIEFTEADFMKWTEEAVAVGMWLATVWFVYESFATLYYCLRSKTFVQKMWNLLKYAAMLAICIYMFAISMVPLSTVAKNSKPWQTVNEWHAATDKYQLVHSYGLFRRMTGVGGRPEVVLEGSMLETGPWQEIPFLYKPGNTTRGLPCVAPHQPRLDWQMWFAALGQYQHNTWFVNLANKILIGEGEVLKLLDWENYPFKANPPNFVRADLYHYRFTRLRRDGSIPKGVWTRKHSRSYLPVLSKDDKQLKEFLNYYKLSTTKRKKPAKGMAADVVALLRVYLEAFSPQTVLWILFLTALLISEGRRYLLP